MEEETMNIGIIGSGPAGLYSAIFLKIKHPEHEVFVFDKEQKASKKLYATGNGHCNLLNKNLKGNKYNNQEYMDSLLKMYPYQFLENVLKSLGIQLMEIDDYVYPLSFSAPTYALYLKKLAEKVGVKFVLETRIQDFKKVGERYELIGSDKVLDKLIIATGGRSQENLGSDGSFFKAIKDHGYEVSELRPGLTPLILNDRDIKPLAGVRHDALVKAFVNGEQIFEEKGEILYKNDGVSGIVIFNAESAIYRQKNPKNIELVVDLFPEINEKELQDRIIHDEHLNSNFYLDAYMVEPLQKHILNRAIGKNAFALAKAMKGLTYQVKDHYDFKSSQVTIGGVSLKDVNEYLESKHEKGVYFVGEVLDIDGNCGGYNLTWDLLSALLVFKSF